MNILQLAFAQNSETPSLSVTKQSFTTKSPQKQQKECQTGRTQFIKIMSQQQKYSGDDIDPLILAKAISNSTIQRMSGNYEKVELPVIMNKIIDFAIQLSSVQNNKKEDISNRQWCIVQIDQQFLSHSGIGRFHQKLLSCGSNCSSHLTNQQRSQYNIINHIELPSSIRPYCLVLNMNGKQLHFQSQQQSENHFFINLDTVSIQISTQAIIDKNALLKNRQTAQRFLNKPITLKINDKQFKLEINMYITQFTLPYPFRDIATAAQKLQERFNIRQSLYQTLYKNVLESKGRQLKTRKVLDRSLLSETKFYNYRFATQQQFVKYCETGDILLFKDNHTMAKIQRAITNSQYDHVAIVYRHEKLGICLFQSSSATGVGIANWRTLINHRWWENIEKISWRKLQIDKKPKNFEQKVSSFINGNLRKQFGISLPKLLKFRAAIDAKQDNNQTYFCSQLAATLYKYLGLLDPQKSCTQYWPKDFADFNGIQILNGALDFQRQLVFQQSVLKKSYPLLK